MTQESWLFAWIGAADHQAAEADDRERLGPIASALLAHERFDRVVLLTNYGFERSKPYCDWLEALTSYVDVDLYEIELSSPINYAEIYEKVSAELKRARLPRQEVLPTFHLSPGTPAMIAVWILLAKTRFPARLIQTSAQRGLERVDFNFDLASDFLPEYLKRSEDRIERLAGEQLGVPEFARIIHRSPAMRKQVDRARRIAAFDVPVLVLGETGTGKELFAQAVHAASKRSNRPFIPVNCGAILRELANAELFGHKRGAFTGADRDRDGHFKAAEGGTLFLDEIGDMPLPTQARLLRVLQERCVQPVGSSEVFPVDLRIISATNRALRELVQAGRFREDLYYRIGGLTLELPPLRERTDKQALFQQLWQQHREPTQWAGLSAEVLRLFEQHPWPGNLRQVSSVLQVALAMAEEQPIRAEHLPDDFFVDLQATVPLPKPEHLDERLDLNQRLEAVGGNISHLARELGVSRNTLYKRLRQHEG